MKFKCKVYTVTYKNCIVQSDEVNACATDPCYHGECVNEGDGYVCNCEDGFEGVNCQSKIGLTSLLIIIFNVVI